jgi:hypothetical protein
MHMDFTEEHVEWEIGRIIWIHKHMKRKEKEKYFYQF